MVVRSRKTPTGRAIGMPGSGAQGVGIYTWPERYHLGMAAGCGDPRGGWSWRETPLPYRFWGSAVVGGRRPYG
eukprot:scaffold62808_cov46-Prasinocladus_malaysianus.AAC.1